MLACSYKNVSSVAKIICQNGIIFLTKISEEKGRQNCYTAKFQHLHMLFMSFHLPFKVEISMKQTRPEHVYYSWLIPHKVERPTMLDQILLSVTV